MLQYRSKDSLCTAFRTAARFDRKRRQHGRSMAVCAWFAVACRRTSSGRERAAYHFMAADRSWRLPGGL